MGFSRFSKVLIYPLPALIFLVSALYSAARPFSSPQDPEVIENPGEPIPKPGRRTRIEFTEELCIGEVEGDENYIFGESIQINVDDEGCIYVVDWDYRHIKKFAPDGTYLCQIGKKGQGPGEFANIWSPEFDREGHFYATDYVNQRVSFFDRDGRYLKQIKIPESIGGVFLLSNGTYLTQKTIQEEDHGMNTYFYVHGIYDSDFNLLFELHRDKQEMPRRGNRSMAEFTADIWSRMAFVPWTQLCVSKDERIHFGFPETYEVQVRAIDGRLLKTIRKDHKPVKIEKKHRDYYFETQVAPIVRRPSLNSVQDEVRKHMRYPKYLPAYQRFMLMENGWLFVVVESLLDDPATIDLFDEKGVYVGHFQTDVPCDSLDFYYGKAYTVAVIDDYHYVKRYGYTLKKY